MAGYGWIPPSHCAGSFYWIPSQGGQVPPGAVQGGLDQDGSPLYVGRTFHCGDLLPCKVSQSHGCAFIAYGGQEISKQGYEVLVSDQIAWRQSSDGHVPPEAIKIGQTAEGEPLFIGRVMHEGTLTPGKIHPSHNCLYISFAGSEMPFNDYEVLILI